MSSIDILALVEDPGAANLTLDLAKALSNEGLSFGLWAAGDARSYLAAREVEFVDVDNRVPRLEPDTARLVAVGTSETRDAPAFALLAAAHAHGIATVGLVDSPANAAARFRGTTDDPFAHLPGHLIVTDTATHAAFVDLGIDKTRITIAMNPALLRARVRGMELTRAGRAEQRARLFGDDSGPAIVFLSELSGGLDAAAFRRTADYTLTGRGGSDARTNIVLETLLDAAAALTPRPRIVVRLHPKEVAAAYDAYADALYCISYTGDPLDDCEAADLVVGMTTTLLSEAHQMGQRVLSILPRPIEQSWLADLANGSIACVWQPDAVVPAIGRALASQRRQPPPPTGATLADVLAHLVGGPSTARAVQTG